MIIVKLQGGLGNQMFQYALGRELQRRNGGTLVLDLTWLLDRTPRKDVIYRDYDLDVFEIRPHFSLLSHVARRFSVPLAFMYGSKSLSRLRAMAGIERRLVESPELRPEEVLEAKGNLYLDGYWPNPRYFEGCEQILRREFMIRQPISAAGQKVAALMETTDSICVNVRRGDFVTLTQSRQAHGFVGKEYYPQKLPLITSQVRNPHIFITSDDVEWCRGNLKFDFPTMVLGHEYKGYKFGEYLSLMAHCKHFLIPNSTFAWWAAWMNPSQDKIVISPDNWIPRPR